ncbi:transcriptional coactivator p15/PC4 family protein [Paracoccus aminophilus]|uniref:Transcriptional coactivator p15 (PC4) C-terminal domain-containing protein n=1 Tax=Paracoccus aminophilus JCM 7686 TaxID=1367847 RepID=S5XLN2_PARAH|nr:transcriptional coactivator p15/PC4 family protein [Paracoccus aminophilus]AGT08119.1 hypothetical protein JCM7686_1010 [Paracoccus aminophilus JCM 7686]
MQLAIIPKNQREEIRLSLDDYKGMQLVNLRIWFKADDGEFRPSQKGIAFKAELLPAVLEGLQAAQKGGTA